MLDPGELMRSRRASDVRFYVANLFELDKRVHQCLDALQMVVDEMEQADAVTCRSVLTRYFRDNPDSFNSQELLYRADARRAKLYYLRDRVGKSRRLRDKRRGLKHVEGLSTVHR